LLIVSTKGVVEWEVEQFVRTSLFPKCKFITNNESLEYSSDHKSLSQIILTGINCIVPNEETIWNTHKLSILNLLKVCRSNATAAVKNGFTGM